MISRGTPDFWEAYYALPLHIREAARSAYRKFERNPSHPSLKLERLRRMDASGLSGSLSISAPSLKDLRATSGFGYDRQSSRFRSTLPSVNRFEKGFLILRSRLPRTNIQCARNLRCFGQHHPSLARDGQKLKSLREPALRGGCVDDVKPSRNVVLFSHL